MQDNPVRVSTSHVVSQANHVYINENAIDVLVQNLLSGNVEKPLWQAEYHLQTKDERVMLTYLFILDALNFCVWPRNIDDKKWQVKIRGIEHKGYYAWSLALAEYFNKNPYKSNFEHFSTISREEFFDMHQGGINLQFMTERWSIVRTLSTYMVRCYDGDPTKFIKTANGNIARLVDSIANELDGFNDYALYNGEPVYFYKRAQILVADMMTALPDSANTQFDDPSYLTAFADQAIPQILRHWAILKYSHELASIVDRGALLQAGSIKEVEIRAATIQAVEMIHKRLVEAGLDWHPFQVDYMLWNTTKEIEIEGKAHRTPGIFY